MSPQEVFTQHFENKISRKTILEYFQQTYSYKLQMVFIDNHDSGGDEGRKTRSNEVLQDWAGWRWQVEKVEKGEKGKKGGDTETKENYTFVKIHSAERAFGWINITFINM